MLQLVVAVAITGLLNGQVDYYYLIVNAYLRS